MAKMSYQKGLTEYLVSMYKDRMIFNGEIKEWYLYEDETKGVWTARTKMEVEQRILFDLDDLTDEIDNVREQVLTAIKAVEESNREKKEKIEIIKELKKQLPKSRTYTIRFVENLRRHISRVLLIKKNANE